MLANGIIHSRFDLAELPQQQQLPTYCEQLGNVIEVVPLREQIGQPFACINDRYEIGEFRISDTYTDRVVIERTIARISRDNARGIGFTIFLDGDAHVANTSGRRQEFALSGGSVLATDLDQPIRVARQACRYLTLVVPRNLLEHVFSDPGAIHGRLLDPRKPATQLVVMRAKALVENCRRMPFEDARRALADLVQLIVDAFGQEAGLSGSKPAVNRALMFEFVRSYVRANLQEDGLSPQRVIDTLRFPRSTIYRLFEHEGGLGAYIQHLRLRVAANELIRTPRTPIKDIGYSLGFKSAEHFTRAFQSAYEITPRELRRKGFIYSLGET